MNQVFMNSNVGAVNLGNDGKFRFQVKWKRSNRENRKCSQSKSHFGYSSEAAAIAGLLLFKQSKEEKSCKYNTICEVLFQANYFSI